MPGADLLVTGRIATLAGREGPAWVDAVAIRGGRIVGAGTFAEVESAVGPGTRRLALAPGEVAIPGLTDAHLHLAETAMATRTVQLEGCRSRAGLADRVRAAAALGGDSWIEGAGWDADLLGGWPTADDLEAAAPGRLVAVWAHDHHALLVSHGAMRLAAIDGDLADPAGGVIRRDASLAATGVLHEGAAQLVAALVPAPTDGDVADAIVPLVRQLVSLGVVAAHDPGGLSEPHDLGGPMAAYRALAAAGALGMRVHACVRSGQLEAAGAEGLRSGRPLGPDPLDRLRMGWLKTFADGSLGSRTAALLQPVQCPAGEPRPPNDGYGVWLATPDELRAQAVRAADLGIATQVHAIGDAAVRVALDVLGPTVGRTALMPRVEHAQLVSEADAARFASLGIAASVQPVHLRSDAEKARRLWGARADARAFAFSELDRTGAVIAFGTDAPVEPVDPWTGIACAVTRASPEWAAGVPPLGAHHALPLWRAVRAACVDPAITAGETDRGRLVPGHRADLVVIPAAAVEEPVEIGGALWHARPRLVLVDGEVAAGG